MDACSLYDTVSSCGLGRQVSSTRPSVFTTRTVLNLMHRGWILPIPRILPRIPARASLAQLHALLVVGTRYAVEEGTRACSLVIGNMKLDLVWLICKSVAICTACIPRSWWGGRLTCLRRQCGLRRDPELEGMEGRKECVWG
jgi:hypothetical protein